MTRWLALAIFVLALTGCANRPTSTEAFSFAVVGDSPYNDREVLAFDAMMAVWDAEPLAFVVHVGDFKGGDAPCTDALYRDRKSRLDASRHPLILTPGDNDWTDCRRGAAGGHDPLERLEKLRQVFFSDNWSLGRSRMRLAVQSGCVEREGDRCLCAALPENRQWTSGGVVFATIHVVGSNDNRGYDARSDAEQRCRADANREWIAHAFRLVRQPGMRGLALFTQADPWVGGRDGVYDKLVAQVAEGAKDLAKPLLFVHGDTHWFRFDRPFRDANSRRVENALRLETFGSPVVGWVHVTVDPAREDLFRVRARLDEPAGG